jgi:large subunit ribosomal protein L23
MARADEIIIRPIISERTMGLVEENKYAFYVDKRANKVEIKKAVEELFEVSVEAVNTANITGKNKRMGKTSGRTPDRKKAIVTLKPGSKIELFEGL